MWLWPYDDQQGHHHDDSFIHESCNMTHEWVMPRPLSSHQLAVVRQLDSTMPIGLFQEIATASFEFLRRFSTAPTTVQIWKAWEAFGRSAMGWPSVLVKACIRQDVNDGGYTLRDFTHSLRFLALDLLSKVASAAFFRELDQDLQKNIIQSIISHLDDFRPEGSCVTLMRNQRWPWLSPCLI